MVYLNRFDERDELHRANRDWLATREGLEIVTDPEALVERIGGYPSIRFGGVISAVMPFMSSRSPTGLK